jgi:Zn-dependent protease
MSTHAEKKEKNGLWGILAAIGIFLLSKLKWVLALFKIGKFATLASMFISLGSYAVFYGWKFAFAIVYLIFVHEMGHLVAAKMKKIPTSPAIFIPFMGAVIGVDPKKIKDAKEEFFIAYGGPLAGLISILPPFFLYWFTHDPYWALMVQLGALINLFNLFPVSPLDGGRIVGVLSTKIWFIGLLVMIPIIFISPDPIFIFIFILGIITWAGRLREQFKLHTLNHQLSLLQDVKRNLEWIENNRNAELPLTESNEYKIFRNTLEQRKDSLHTFLKSKPFYFPIFQDKKRIEVKKANLEDEILIELLEKLDSLEKKEMEDEVKNINVSPLIHEYEKEIQELTKEVKRLKSYYKSSIGTKIRALFLYLALAAVLAAFLVYSMDILNMSF